MGWMMVAEGLRGTRLIASGSWSARREPEESHNCLFGRRRLQQLVGDSQNALGLPQIERGFVTAGPEFPSIDHRFTTQAAHGTSYWLNRTLSEASWQKSINYEIQEVPTKPFGDSLFQESRITSLFVRKATMGYSKLWMFKDSNPLREFTESVKMGFIAPTDDLQIVIGCKLHSIRFNSEWRQFDLRPAAKHLPGEVNKFIESHNRSVMILTVVLQAWLRPQPRLPAFPAVCHTPSSPPSGGSAILNATAVSLPPHHHLWKEPSISHRYPTATSASRIQTPRGMCPTFYGRLFKVFLPFSKHSEMFHLLSLILGSQIQKNNNKKTRLLLVFHFFFLLSGFQQLGIDPTTPETPAGACPHAASVEVHLAWPLAGCSSGLVFKVCSHNNKTIEPSTPIYSKQLSSTSCPARLSRIHRCLVTWQQWQGWWRLRWSGRRVFPLNTC